MGVNPDCVTLADGHDLLGHEHVHVVVVASIGVRDSLRSARQHALMKVAPCEVLVTTAHLLSLSRWS